MSFPCGEMASSDHWSSGYNSSVCQDSICQRLMNTAATSPMSRRCIIAHQGRTDLTDFPSGRHDNWHIHRLRRLWPPLPSISQVDFPRCRSTGFRFQWTNFPFSTIFALNACGVIRQMRTDAGSPADAANRWMLTGVPHQLLSQSLNEGQTRWECVPKPGNLLI